MLCLICFTACKKPVQSVSLLTVYLELIKSKKQFIFRIMSICFSFQEWKEMYHKACISMQNRETKIEDAANMIETDLILLGATAVEDKLQDQVIGLRF